METRAPELPAASKDPQLKETVNKDISSSSRPLPQLHTQGLPLRRPNFSITKVQTRKEKIPSSISLQAILKQKIPRLHPTEQATQTPGRDDPGPEEKMVVVEPRLSAVSKDPRSKEACSEDVTRPSHPLPHLHPHGSPSQQPNCSNRIVLMPKRGRPASVDRQAISMQKIPRLHSNERFTKTLGREEPGPQQRMELVNPQQSADSKVPQSEEASSGDIAASSQSSPHLHSQGLPIRRPLFIKTENKIVQTRMRGRPASIDLQAISLQKIPRLYANEQFTQTPGKDDPVPEEGMELGPPELSAISKDPQSDEACSGDVSTTDQLPPRLYSQEFPFQRPNWSLHNVQTPKRFLKLVSVSLEAIAMQNIPRLHPTEQATQTP